MWRLEVSDDGVTWSLADARNTLQPVTYYRRRIAAFGSQEDGSVRTSSESRRSACPGSHSRARHKTLELT